jgi:hypothetical protein
MMLGPRCWPIAEAAGHRGPHRLQHLLSRAVWDDQQVLDWRRRHQHRARQAHQRWNAYADATP